MSISTDIHIRLSELKDIPALTKVEKSAAKKFLDIPELAWLANDDVMTHEMHQKAILEKTSWTAQDEQSLEIVGFLSGQEIASEFHLQEVSVCAEYQGRSIGKALVETALQHATLKGLISATLTTFVEVPWNAPFYKKLGFEIIEYNVLSVRLSNLLLAENSHGLAGEKRCAMRKCLASTPGD